MYKRIHVIVLIFLVTLSAQAQFYDSGQDPASIKWRKIKTNHFRILFPEKIENIAQQLANALESGYIKASYSLNVLPGKITVILHPTSILSNAQVAWAPRRMEFVTTPAQDNDTQDWVDQLAIHEYRHLVQLSSVNRKFSHVLSWFFGEQLTAGIMGAFVPFWFIEGDATLTETLLSNAGRGRLPSFEVNLRSQLLEKGPYSYDKAVFGSYRDFIPDHYVLGYHLVTMGRREFGSGLWDTALQKVAACPIMITPFNHGIRKVTGLSKVKLYKRYMHQLDSLWRKSLKNVEIKPSERLTAEPKTYTAYSHPILLSNGKLLAMKSGINDISRIVYIDSSGKSKKIVTPGYFSHFSLSAASNKIVWAEMANDPRWENRNYSVIYLYDSEKKRKRKLSHKSRLFAPSLSPDAKTIATISIDLQNINSLLTLDATTGKILQEIKTPYGSQLLTPSWSAEGNGIVAVLLNKQGKQLIWADNSLNMIKSISVPDYFDISNPVMYGSQVYFSSPYSGIDNIYVLDTLSRKIFMVTSVRFGAYDPCVSGDGKDLYFSETTATGNIISRIAIDTNKFIIREKVTDVSPHLYKPLLEQEQGVIQKPDSLTIYPSVRYYKFLHLLNPHSWGPISVNASSETVKPGLTIMSQNKLATLTGTLGWEYSINERTGTYFADVSFKQWYPVFDFRFEYGSRSSYYADSSDNQIKYNWKQTSFRSSIRVPLNLSAGKWLIWLQPRFSSTYYKVDKTHNMPENSFIGFIRTFDYNIYWSSQIISTGKDIYPRWGQSLSLDYRHTPFDGYMLGDIMAARTSFYFPGIGRHHNFYINASWQKNTNKPFKYSDIISYPRGLHNKYDDQFWSLRFNYTLPMAYPDAHLGSVFYLKRLWANLFYDHAQGSYNDKLNIYKSAGLELYADVHIFRFLAPFSIGGRLSWLPGSNQFVPEFLYKLNLSGIQ